MANEGGQETVVVDGGAPASEGATKPAGNTNGQPNTESPVAGAKPAAGRDYDKEIAGIRADLIKERKARQQYEADVKAAKAEVDAERRRVQALVGVTPKSPQEQDEEAIKQRFNQLYPELGTLSKEDIEALREWRKEKDVIRQERDLQWQRHNDNIVRALTDKVSKEIGGKLTERQTNRMIDAYAAAAQADPEFLRRHQMGDQTLVDEFAKEWIEDWFEPARRKVTQQEVQRQRVVPSGKDRGIVTQAGKKIDVTDNDQVMDFLIKGRKERGESFGR